MGMESKIDVKGLLAQTITGTYIALQEELSLEEPGQESLVMYKALLNNIVSYTALCGHQPEGCVDWLDQTCGVDTDLMLQVLNDFEVASGLTELGVDATALAGLLPVKEESRVSSLLAIATGDRDSSFMNEPVVSGWAAPDVFIASVLPISQQDSIDGLDHCVAILTKVFVKLYYKFVGKTYEEADRIANELLKTRSSEVAECMNVESGVAPTIADTITVAEAVHWLAGYVSTGAVGSFQLAYAGYGEEEKYARVRPKKWNCMKTTSASVMTEYPNYGLIKEGHGRDIPILTSSVDTLKVTMQEGQL